MWTDHAGMGIGVKVKSPDAVPLDGLRYDAFIAYSRSDVTFAAQVQTALKDRGRTAWLDVEYIPGGADWADRIEREIARCKSFIFIVTERSLGSRACGDELRQAIHLKKKIIPIRHGAEPDSDLPRALEKREWVFLRTAEEFDRGIARLVEALEVDLEWRDQLTDLAERAMRWAAGGGEVLRGSDLRSAEHCLVTQTSHAQQLTTQQTDYILSSRRARGRAQRNRLVAVVIALVATSSAAVIALIQREAARTETRRAQAALLAIQAPQTDNPQLASLQAVEAYELGNTVDTRSAVLGQFNAARRGLPLTGQYGQVLALGFTPNTDMIMSGGAGGTLASWNAQTQRRLALFRVGGRIPTATRRTLWWMWPSRRARRSQQSRRTRSLSGTWPLVARLRRHCTSQSRPHIRATPSLCHRTVRYWRTRQAVTRPRRSTFGVSRSAIRSARRFVSQDLAPSTPLISARRGEPSAQQWKVRPQLSGFTTLPISRRLAPSRPPATRWPA